MSVFSIGQIPKDIPAWQQNAFRKLAIANFQTSANVQTIARGDTLDGGQYYVNNLSGGSSFSPLSTGTGTTDKGTTSTTTGGSNVVGWYSEKGIVAPQAGITFGGSVINNNAYTGVYLVCVYATVTQPDAAAPIAQIHLTWQDDANSLGPQNSDYYTLDLSFGPNKTSSNFTAQLVSSDLQYSVYIPSYTAALTEATFSLDIRVIDISGNNIG